MAQITATHKDLLLKHLDLVIKANETTNITRITSYEDAKLLHIEDSLVGIPYINKAPAGLYGDMGTGAGFPGIPVAVETGRNTVLIESVGKKAAILTDIVQEMGLSKVFVYSGRLEDLAIEKRNSFAVLSARALSKLSCLMELASPLLQLGGLLVCYKGTPEDEEVKHAKSLQNKLGLNLIVADTFTLSDGITNRSIYVFEKTHEAKIKLPRHVGFAQKKPL